MADLTGTGRRVLLQAGRREMSKDAEHLLPKRPAAAKGIIRRHWSSSGVLDQGSTSQCVVYACDKFLTTFPVKNPGFLTAQERERVYKEVQRDYDEWPGDNYDGTSVRGMMKWLHKKGFISGYKWGFDVETVVNHVLAYGPIEMGTIWDASMSNPDREGYIWPDADDSDDEGHAWTIIGADKERRHKRWGLVGAVRMINSWGPGWGQQGRAWITFDHLDKLLKLAGEAAVAMEIKA